MKQWDETIFENYGKKYDSESFTQGTIGECDFIEQEINFNDEIRLGINFSYFEELMFFSLQRRLHQ